MTPPALMRCVYCDRNLTELEPIRCQRCNGPLCRLELRDCWRAHFETRHEARKVEEVKPL